MSYCYNKFEDITQFCQSQSLYRLIIASKCKGTLFYHSHFLIILFVRILNVGYSVKITRKRLSNRKQKFYMYRSWYCTVSTVQKIPNHREIKTKTKNKQNDFFSNSSSIICRRIIIFADYFLHYIILREFHHQHNNKL